MLPASKPDKTSSTATGPDSNSGTTSVNTTVTSTSEDPTVTTPQNEPKIDGNNTESTEPILAGTTAVNNTGSTSSNTIDSVPALTPGDQADTLPGTTHNNKESTEPTLAGTTTDDNTVSTSSHSIDCAPASTTGNQTNTLPGTTHENTLPSLLPATIPNKEPTSVDTSQETIEVIVGSIKSDPTTIDILLSEGSSNSRKSPALPEVQNAPKDEPDPVTAPTTPGCISSPPYHMNYHMYTFQKQTVHLRIYVST